MAHLPPLPRHTRIVEREGQQTTRFADWMLLLVTAVDRLTDGIVDTITTGSLTVTGAVTAGSAVIAGAITGASLAVTGAITAATATLSGLLTLNGGQIQFPAVQVPSAGANVLDDYEESVAAIVPTSPNITYAAGSLFHYQKIGRWVHVTGLIVFPVTADANVAEIDNLPYTCENDSPSRGGCVNYFGNFGVSVGFFVLANTTRVQLFTPTTAAAITNATLSGLNGFFDFKYRATA